MCRLSLDTTPFCARSETVQIIGVRNHAGVVIEQSDLPVVPTNSHMDAIGMLYRARTFQREQLDTVTCL
jgi:hypothetical protein